MENGDTSRPTRRKPMKVPRVQWNDSERECVANLVLSTEIASILFPDANTTVGTGAKQKAWEDVRDRFNATENMRRKTIPQLKECWKNLLSAARERRRGIVSRFKNLSNNVFSLIHTCIPEMTLPLENIFDSDAGFHPQVVTADRQMRTIPGDGAELESTQNDVSMEDDNEQAYTNNIQEISADQIF